MRTTKDWKRIGERGTIRPGTAAYEAGHRYGYVIEIGKQHLRMKTQFRPETKEAQVAWIKPEEMLREPQVALIRVRSNYPKEVEPAA